MTKFYSKPSIKNYPTNETKDNHIDEICSIDLVDKIGYKISNNKGYRHIFNKNDNLSKHLWAILLKKLSQIVTNELSNI